MKTQEVYQPLAERTIVYGITGSVAAGVKSAELIRLLAKTGAKVHTVMTQSARRFVTPELVRALAGGDAFFDPWQVGLGLGGEPHVGLRNAASAFLVAPLTSTTLAQLATGLDGTNTVALTYRALRKDGSIPILLAPSMDERMWLDAATQRNVASVREASAEFVGPENGPLASGHSGWGRMAEPSTILGALRFALGKKEGFLRGKKVVITAGPTREAMDDVRFITNHSTGVMAYALGEVARDQGADVVLISSVSRERETPHGARVVAVSSAAEMLAASVKEAEDAYAFIGAAAVADYGVPEKRNGKTSRREQPTLTLNLTANPDVIRSVNCPRKFGFAAELPEGLIEKAAHKLSEKGLRAIFANPLDRAMGSPTNTGTILFASGERIEISEMPKICVAEQLLRHWFRNLRD